MEETKKPVKKAQEIEVLNPSAVRAYDHFHLPT